MKGKTKAQLSVELEQMRRQVDRSKAFETEYKQTEKEIRRRTAQLEALQEIGLALTTELDLDSLLQAIATRAMELFEAGISGVFLYRPEREALELVVTIGRSTGRYHGTFLQRGEGLAGKIWESGQPLNIDNYQQWSGQADIYQELPLTTIMGVPIQWGQEFLGVLNVGNRPACFSQADVELLSLFAAQAAVAIRNARLVNSLRESEERFRQLAENIKDVFWITSPDGSEVIYVSPAYEEIWGRSRRNLSEWPYTSIEAILPEDRERVLAANKQTVATLQSREYEYRVSQSDGTIRWVRGRSFPVLNEQGQIYRIAGIAEDISARKQAEEKIRQRTAQLEALCQVGLALTTELNLDILLQTFATHATKLLGAGASGIYLYRPEQEALELAIATGEATKKFQGTFLRRGEGVGGKVWASGQPIMVDNYQQWSGQAPKFETLAVMNILSVPIQWSQEFLGVLGVINRPTPFDSTDTELLSLLATQAAAAIRNARLVSSLRQSEQRYRNLARKNARLYTETQQRLKAQTALHEAATIISSSLDLSTVLERIAEQMSRAIEATSAYICDYEPDKLTSTVLAEYISEAACVLERENSDLNVTYFLPEEYPGILESLRVGHTRLVHHNTPGLPEVEQRHMQQFGIKSVLVIPLQIRGQVIAYAELWESRCRREFTSQEISQEQAIAQHAVIAIENARLLKQARRDAETKALLLEEVNHRVKNNLTTIIGLLYAERDHHPPGIENQDFFQKILQDLIYRIQGLATVHSLLSAVEWMPLSLSELTRQIIASALQIAPPDAQIRVEIPPASLQVTPQQANSLALVINELATNAVKYALSKQRTAQIVVRIEQTDGMILFEFRTSGPGYPPEVLNLERYNTGIYLVQHIIRKGLRGVIILHNDSGAVATIYFPARLN